MCVCVRSRLRVQGWPPRLHMSTPPTQCLHACLVAQPLKRMERGTPRDCMQSRPACALAWTSGLQSLNHGRYTPTRSPARVPPAEANFGSRSGVGVGPRSPNNGDTGRGPSLPPPPPPARAITLYMSAQSAAVPATTPFVTHELMEVVDWRGTRCTEGMRPTMPQCAAGMRMLPPASDASANGTRPAATTAALPARHPCHHLPHLIALTQHPWHTFVAGPTGGSRNPPSPQPFSHRSERSCARWSASPHGYRMDRTDNSKHMFNRSTAW